MQRNLLLMLLVMFIAACSPSATPQSTLAPTSALATNAAPAQNTSAPAATATIARPTTVPTTAPQAAKTLRFSSHAKEQNLTPWNQGTGYPGYYMMTLMYDTLFWLDPNNVPQPWLVDTYKVGADGKTWTLSLKDGVKWQDGSALTSDDVKFTVEYLRKFPRPRYTPPLAPITDVTTPDARTIVFTLKEPSAGFLRQPLADLPILPRKDWEKVEDPTKRTTD